MRYVCLIGHRETESWSLATKDGRVITTSELDKIRLTAHPSMGEPPVIELRRTSIDTIDVEDLFTRPASETAREPAPEPSRGFRWPWRKRTPGTS